MNKVIRPPDPDETLPLPDKVILPPVAVPLAVPDPAFRIIALVPLVLVVLTVWVNARSPATVLMFTNPLALTPLTLPIVPMVNPLASTYVTLVTLLAANVVTLLLVLERLILPL